MPGRGGRDEGRRFVEHAEALILQIEPTSDGDDEELAQVTQRLRASCF